MKTVENGFVMLKDSEVQQYYTLLSDLMKFLTQNNIVFWACSGTLLGSVRHKAIIPWDDDMDLMFFAKDEDTVCGLKPLLLSEGFDLIKWWGGYKFYRKPELDTQKEPYPFIDLFPVKKIMKTYRFARPFALLRWTKEYFFPEELFPLDQGAFGPLSVPVPHDSHPYLDRLYGSDWNSVGKQSYDHKNNKKIKPARIQRLDDGKKISEK